MRKVLRIVRNIIFGVFLVLYLSVIICASTLVLKRNDFGYTQFGNKSLLDIRENTDKYSKGQLVVVERKSIDNLKAGDEVFIYQTNQTEKTVKIVSSTIKEVFTEENNPYVTINLDDSAWGQDYIAGQKVKVYDSIGGVLSFVESKWIFFVIFIVPCFFILLYEIYSVIIVIKFEGGDAAALENPNVVPQTEPQNGDNISSLMNEINNLKSQLNQGVAPASTAGTVTPNVGANVQPQVQQQPQNAAQQVIAQTQVQNPETIVIGQQPAAQQQPVIQQVQTPAATQTQQQAKPTITQSQPVILSQQPATVKQPKIVVPNNSATPTIVQNSTQQNNNQTQGNKQSNQEIL